MKRNKPINGNAEQLRLALIREIDFVVKNKCPLFVSNLDILNEWDNVDNRGCSISHKLQSGNLQTFIVPPNFT